jgi:hypothetical protein
MQKAHGVKNRFFEATATNLLYDILPPRDVAVKTHQYLGAIHFFVFVQACIRIAVTTRSLGLTAICRHELFLLLKGWRSAEF